MYEAYWGFSELPFLNAGHRPASRMHEEAMCRIVFLLESDHPIALLSGKKGSGKSSLLQQLKNRWKKSSDFSALHVDFEKIPIHEVGSSLSAQADCSNVADETEEKSWTTFQDIVREKKQGRFLAIFDHVSAKNDEAFGIVKYVYHLAQQPEFPLNLVVVLDTDGEGEIEQRQIERYLDLSVLQNEVGFLTRFDTLNYIQRALVRVGSRRKVFDEEASNAIFDSTGGQIGKVNRLCDVCLLAGMLDRRESINDVIVHAAAAELWSEKNFQFDSIPDSNLRVDDIVLPEDVLLDIEESC